MKLFGNTSLLTVLFGVHSNIYSKPISSPLPNAIGIGYMLTLNNKLEILNIIFLLRYLKQTNLK